MTFALTRSRNRSGLRLAGLAAGLALGLLVGRPAAAGEVVIFDGPVPDPARLAGILWPKAADLGPAPGAVRTRGLQVNRATAAASPAESGPTAFAFLIQFAFDSSEVLPVSQPYLDSIGSMLRLPEAKGRTVLIVGHADASGSSAYNQKLSERRAGAVKSYLSSRFGIPAGQLVASGEGETSPLPGLDPYADRNRRVEFRADAPG